MPESPTVTVIVLNYNGRQHLEGCLPSLLQIEYPSDCLRLMVMDNGSTDDSVAFITREYPEVQIVRSEKNLGFAAGNNMAVRHTDSQYVIFLNNDMRVDSQFVRELIDAVQSEPDVVCAGAKILNWDGSRYDFAGSAAHFAGYAYQLGFGSPVTEGSFEDLCPTLFACGGAMIIDRQVFLDTGGFDEDYFIYFEDMDLGWRLWVLGHKVVFAPKAIAYHHHHGTMRSFADHRKALLTKRNALYSVIKNYEDSAMPQILAAALLELTDGVVTQAIRKHQIDPDDFSITGQRSCSTTRVTLDRELISTLVAIHEVVQALPHVMEKRRTVQSRRCRRDAEVLGLFRRPFRFRTEMDASAQHSVIEAFDLHRLFGSGRRRVLVFSSDILPYPGLPTVGSGLRAWGLGEGLKSADHEVIFSMPRAALKGREHLVPPDVASLAWEWYTMHELVRQTEPDVVIVCNWPLLDMMDAEKVEVPIVLDQHGPHLLERDLQGFGDHDDNARRKINALRKADYFTCAGHRQLKYFQTWLEQAKWSERERQERSCAIPLSLSPELPERQPRTELTFVYGGVFLPWQDPSVALSVLVEEMERREQGQLRFFGGRHLVYPMNTGVFEPLATRLRQSHRVIVSELVSHAELIEEYRQAHVAIDLMKRNPERELAFTTRTVEYLWCGLPVIYNDYSELSAYIQEYQAGWTINPDDRDAIRRVLAEIFDRPDLVAERSLNARRLVTERLTWDRTIKPLDTIVRHADFRPSADRSKERWLQHLVERTMVRFRHGGLSSVAREVVPYMRWRLGHYRSRSRSGA